LKIVFISTGSIRKGYVKEGVREYIKRINRYCPAELIEVKEERGTKKGPSPGGLKKEAGRILSRVDGADYKCVLASAAAGSRSFDSAGFARFIERLLQGEGGKKRVCFIVGGPFGLHPELLESADTVLSLTPMTMAHELAALVLAEQVYRAFTIIRGEPYSH
jgi:23S rRNA (pseudouridine1915-N3)-methyltransferase